MKLSELLKQMGVEMPKYEFAKFDTPSVQVYRMNARNEAIDEISNLVVPDVMSVEEIKSVAINSVKELLYPDGVTKYHLYLGNNEWDAIGNAIHAKLTSKERS